MFRKIKRKIVEYFGCKKSESKKPINNALTTPIIDGYYVGIDISKGKDITVSSFKTENNGKDIKIKLQKKLYGIAIRTKTGRIRKKNLKRLVDLYDNIN